MWLSLLFFILVLAIAFFQATQGLFNALIMTILTICCAAFAVGTHEWVAINWLAPKWRPDYAMPLALGLTFGITLILVRVAFDQLIRRACLLPSWVDRIGGGVCGFITALLLVGVLGLCLQMLPFNGTFLGYGRVQIPNREQEEGGPAPEAPKPDKADEELFLTPDRFVIALGSVLSDGLFSGDRSFGEENPDYVAAMGWRNAVPSEVPRYAPPNSISLVRQEPVLYVYRMVPRGRDDFPTYDQLNAKEGHEFRMLRVQFKKEAMGSAKGHLFTIRQFRLVGREEGNDNLTQFYPIAIQNQKQEEPQTRHYRVTKFRNQDWPATEEVYAPREGNEGQVEIVFELPKKFEPEYLEYKRGARVAVSFDQGQGGAFETPSTSTSSSTPSAPSENPTSSRTDSRRAEAAASTSGGRVRSVAAEGGAFGDKLPMTLTSYTQVKDGEINHGALANGHLVGNVDDQSGGRNQAVSKFDVPSDKRLLHLTSSRLQARSTLGGALSFAVRTVQNYIVQDANGRQYQMVGKYAVADVDGRKVVEVQYFNDQSGSVGGVGAFSKIKDSHLQGDYTLALLFLVDPGAKITTFSTGGGDNRKQDLTEENLVAPN